MNSLYRRLAICCVLASSCVGLAWGGQTMYGATGYTFVPDGFVDHGQNYGGYFAGEYVSLERVRLYPRFLGLRTTAFSNRLEFTAASTWAFVTSGSGYEPKKIGDGLLPICPGIKWSVDDQQRTYVRWGYAVGLMFPYGAYGSATVRGKLPILQPELTVAIGSTVLKTSYGMVGGRLRLADLHGNPLPLSFSGEGGWAGSMDQLGETEEAFYSLGAEMDMGRNLTLSLNWRKDPRTYLETETKDELEGQNKNGRWGLKLDYHFNGVKVAEGGKQ